MTSAARPALAVEGGATARALLTALLVAAGLTAFQGVRPSQPWLLFFTAAVTGLAAAGTVRRHPRMAGRRDIATVGFALVPIASVLAAGAFADRVLDGHARVAAASAGAAVAGITVLAEYHALDPSARVYGLVRIILAVATYAAAFAIYAVMFQDSVGVVPSVAAVGLATWLMSASLLREGGAIDTDAVIAGFAIGLSLGELRTVLYFFPVDGVLGGALLLVGFHVATGVVHHLLDRDLTPGTLAEYVVIAVLGTAAVAAAMVAA